MSEKETIFTPRASNTVSTLKPTEVQAQDAQDWPIITPAGFGDAKENLRKLMHGDFDGLPDDSGAFAYSPDEPVFHSKYIGVPDLLVRIEKLEAQVDSLLDRIAKHNIRAQHRI